MRGRRIEGLQKYQGRNPRGSFEDLPSGVKQRANSWLWHFQQKWVNNLPQWRHAILVGRAKWLALNPPTSEWGRSMLAKRGGKAVQRKYRMEGRHPTEKATQARVAKQRMQAELKRRKKLGLPPPTRQRFLPL